MSSIPVTSVQSTLRTLLNYITGSCRIAFFMGAGDILVQQCSIIKEKKKLNLERTIKFASIGLIVMGPVLTFWKRSISIIIRNSRNHTTQTLKQLFLDQVYLAPTVNFGIVAMSGVLEKESIQDIENRLSLYFPHITKCHYLLWPGVQFFCGMCIRPALQVAFANFVAVFWYAYISGILHQDDLFEILTNRHENKNLSLKPPCNRELKNGARSIMKYMLRSFSSGLIMSAADVLSQVYIKKREWTEIRKERTIKFASIGIFFTGPLMARWSSFMRKSFDKNSYSLSKAIRKSLYTQIFLAPSLNFGIITFADVLNGFKPTERNLRNLLQGDFFNIMQKNYMIWLPVQFTGCMLRSSFLKFIYIKFVSLVWFGYLSAILMYEGNNPQ